MGNWSAHLLPKNLVDMGLEFALESANSSPESADFTTDFMAVSRLPMNMFNNSALIQSADYCRRPTANWSSWYGSLSPIPTRTIYTSPPSFLMDRPLVWMTKMYLFNNNRCYNQCLNRPIIAPIIAQILPKSPSGYGPLGSDIVSKPVELLHCFLW